MLSGRKKKKKEKQVSKNILNFHEIVAVHNIVQSHDLHQLHESFLMIWVKYNLLLQNKWDFTNN